MNAEQTTNGDGSIDAGARVRKITRYSAEERERLMREQAESGLTKKAFCQQRGIQITTFHGWGKQAKQKRKKAARPKPAFQEINVPVSSRPDIEIALPGGARVALQANGKTEELVRLIRGIAGCGKEQHSC